MYRWRFGKVKYPTRPVLSSGQPTSVVATDLSEIESNVEIYWTSLFKLLLNQVHYGMDFDVNFSNETLRNL